MIRDSQRKRVYLAEGSIDPGYVFFEVKDMQDYVNQITQSKWWKNNYPNIKYIEVKDGRSRTRACGYRSYTGSAIVIKMPKWTRIQRTILHEIAHGLAPGEPWHGKAFCTEYIKIIDQFMGREVAENLIDQFIAHKVEYDLQIM